MKLNLNKLQYDEDTCIYIEKRTNDYYGGIRTEKKYLKSWDEWEDNHWQDQNNKRQDRIKRSIRKTRRANIWDIIANDQAFCDNEDLYF